MYTVRWETTSGSGKKLRALQALALPIFQLGTLKSAVTCLVQPSPRDEIGDRRLLPYTGNIGCTYTNSVYITWAVLGGCIGHAPTLSLSCVPRSLLPSLESRDPTSPTQNLQEPRRAESLCHRSVKASIKIHANLHGKSTRICAVKLGLIAMPHLASSSSHQLCVG